MPSSVYFQWTIWIVVTDFVKKVKLIKDDKKPSILMVGNKCDIVGRRRVTSTRSKAKAQSYDIPHIETFTKLNININRAFLCATGLIRYQKQRKTEPKGRCCSICLFHFHSSFDQFTSSMFTFSLKESIQLSCINCHFQATCVRLYQSLLFTPKECTHAVKLEHIVYSGASVCV